MDRLIGIPSCLKEHVFFIIVQQTQIIYLKPSHPLFGVQSLQNKVFQPTGGSSSFRTYMPNILDDYVTNCGMSMLKVITKIIF